MSDAVVEGLREVAISIGPEWERHVSSPESDDAGAYVDIAVIARHTVKLLEGGETTEVAGIFQKVEELLTSGIPAASRDLVVFGFLEGVQNIGLRNESIALSAFAPFLGPLTLIEWVELHGRWGTTDS